VSPSVTTLLDSIDQAQAKELKSIKEIADRIAAILGKAKPGDPGMTETLKVLRTAVDAAEAANTADGIAKNAGRLTTAVAANAEAVKVAATAKALDDLATAIATARQKYVVYVLSAWFGDRRFPGSRSRQCNITSTVRQECLNAGASCTPSKIANVVDRCGYDPVPYAPEYQKAIAVHYACVPADGGGLQKILDTAPTDLPNSRWETLQGDAVLQCDIQVAAAPKKAAPQPEAAPEAAPEGGAEEKPAAEPADANPKPKTGNGGQPPAEKKKK
jgi:hypothetical protein